MDSTSHGEADRWSPPREFDGFTLSGPIGRGGMGRVFLAHETALDRQVAIKFITAAAPGRAARERFLIEARAVARLQHPNVVAIYRIGEVQGRPYIASEYVAGTSLDRIAKPLPWSRLLQVATQVARGLAEAHRRGVLHRDVKPGNVILADDGVVKLVDFGLAKLGESPGVEPPAPQEAVTESPPTLDPSSRVPWDTGALDTERDISQTLPAAGVALPPGGATITGALLGTPLFIAPEMWSGAPATSRSDVYAAGLLFHELCVGRLPFADLAGPELVRHIRDLGVPKLAEVRKDVPRAFAAAVDRAAARDPEARFASGAELLAALESIQSLFQSFERIAPGTSQDDAALVSASFARLSGRLDTVFTYVYDALFAREPALRVLFPVEMVEQRAKLAGTIRLAVENLRSPERLVPILEDLGRRHIDYGVGPKHLRVFGETLLAGLAHHEGPAWDDSTRTAWERAYEALSAAMEQGMRLGPTARTA